MKREIILSIILFLFSTQSFAQNKARGISEPGTLKKKKEVIIESAKQSGIFCDISFTEPSGDNMLSEGEIGAVKVVVKNYTKNTITPKLTISLKVSINEIYN